MKVKIDMHSNHLKRNTFLALFSIITLSFGTIFYIFYMFQSNRLEETKAQYYQKIKSSFEKNVELHLKEHYTATAEAFLTDEIIKAVAQKDRKKLITLTQNKYNQLKAEDEYLEIMHFHQSDGISLLRLHDLTRYGDNIAEKRAIISTVHKQHVLLCGFDLGFKGFAYRVVIPLFYKKKYVGALEIGANPKKILDLVTHFNNIQGILNFDDNHQNFQYKEIKNKNIIDILPKNKVLPPYFEINDHDHYFAVYSFKITSYDLKPRGEFIFFDDLTKENKQYTDAIKNMVITFIVLIVVLYFFLNLVFNHYTNALSRVTKRTKAILDTQNNIVLVSNGEKIIEANKTFFDFIGFFDLKSFLKQYNCICDLFVREECYLEPKMGEITWTEYILIHPDLTHLAKIIKNDQVYTFKVFANKLDNDIVVSMQDITQELQREQKLKESEKSLNKAQRIAHLGNWELNLNTNELCWSDEIFSIFEIDKNQFSASYTAFLQLVHPDDRSAVNTAYNNSLIKKEKYEITHRLQMPDGRIKYVHEQCDTTFDEDGKPLVSFGIVHDITISVISEKKLREKDTLLQQQSRLAALGEMIGNIAHQWRQPLGSISAIAGSIIIEKELDMEINTDTLVSQMTNINNQVQYLSKTIDDFRNYLKKDQNLTLFNISKVLFDAINIAKASYDDSHITIYTNFDTDITYLGSKSILSQVILNLLSNAKDALIQNEIENKIVTITLNQSHDMIIITVKDNGGGVRDDIKDKIFDPYFTTKHQSQGTGLGLYMSSQIIQNHLQGHLYVSNIEDSNGLGASFVLKFPNMRHHVSN
ncbi:MAG: ATP-binding protein [Sulfuricurvum sp.]|nr:ATP-binding protein [Sulfuricurvum sp.]